MYGDIKEHLVFPDSTHATENDGTDSNGQEVTYTGISTNINLIKQENQQKAINVDVAKGRADVSTFFDTVNNRYFKGQKQLKPRRIKRWI